MFDHQTLKTGITLGVTGVCISFYLYNLKKKKKISLGVILALLLGSPQATEPGMVSSEPFPRNSSEEQALGNVNTPWVWKFPKSVTTKNGLNLLLVQNLKCKLLDQGTFPGSWGLLL